MIVELFTCLLGIYLPTVTVLSLTTNFIKVSKSKDVNVILWQLVQDNYKTSIWLKMEFIGIGQLFFKRWCASFEAFLNHSFRPPNPYAALPPYW